MEQKRNYQIEMEKLCGQLKAEGHRPRLLLHSCCGPCSSYVLECLKIYFDITVFYYNPNIYPESEYEHRLAEQTRLISEMNSELSGEQAIKLVHLPYDHSEFLDSAKGLEKEPEGGLRCTECFRLRLSATRKLAVEEGFEYFGTTLTVSPHKNAILLNRIGEEMASADILWLPSDFKKKEGYKRSIELSKKYDLYRQEYCGCEFAK